MSNPYFIISDFDGTLANTFDISPNGLNVNIASQRAIGDIYGEQGVMAFEQIGGLMNREPGEIINIIQRIIGDNCASLNEATKLFISRKLSYLIPEITENWPRLYPGVVDFFKTVADSRLPVDIGVVSSGHDEFINRVFDIHNIHPNVLVTSDILRSRGKPGGPRYKPHPYQLAEAHRQWENSSSGGQSYIGRNHNKKNMIYIGDDPEKDGGLADRARIPFLFVPFTKPGFEPLHTKGQMLLSNFSFLTDLLVNNTDRLREGDSFTSVIFKRDDRELFPPLQDFEHYQFYERMIKSNHERIS